jgi:hypothetical protein
MESRHAPILVFIVGPPAVGKMTVGHELSRRTGLKLFHRPAAHRAGRARPLTSVAARER